MKYERLQGVIPALTTPFNPDLSLDLDGFGQLASMVIGDGVNGLIVNGCTGESWSLTSEERGLIFAEAVKIAAGRVPVVAGVSAMSSAETIAKIRQAEKAGCDFAMVSPPWYIMPGPDEIADHYARVLAATEMPVLLYNIPRRTGVQLPIDLIDRLADHPKVAGIKESSKDWGILSTVIRNTRDRINVFAGFASFFGLAAVTEGAVGYMDSGTPVFGRLSVEFFQAIKSGDIEKARRLQSDMSKLLDSFFGLGTFPASVKAALEIIGRPGGPTREPIRPLTAAQRETLRETMEKAGFVNSSTRAA